MTGVESFFPAPPLSAYIEPFVFYEGDALPLTEKERCLPDGRVAIVINLGHDTLRVAQPQHDDRFQSFYGGTLNGASAECCIIDTTTLIRTVSICFKPGGARPFLPLPVAELSNQVIDLASIFGTAAVDLREQLQGASTNAERGRMLERFLLAHLSWEQTPHPAVSFALTSLQAQAQRCSISAVTEQLGLSPRRFIHLFEEAVGLTPKVFCRVQRFQEVLQGIKKGQSVQWVDLALSCGYFDQAHFIHDFQSFAGMTPSSYLAQRGEYPNHIPLS